eukprot:CAMPEP_0172840774 /NCGR_PEP_ID=MMETSP1075-20121228/29561_1 /TAXON_ID=2916 /ORGANISM="Ceratium fusus, Strain PA161109" /LENGTH=73 /DNA_ID=CAMNT_0013684667 /DNA_START=33 /DNA_END=254 /DNA_ORIENTATION=+
MLPMGQRSHTAWPPLSAMKCLRVASWRSVAALGEQPMFEPRTARPVPPSATSRCWVHALGLQGHGNHLQAHNP